MNEAVDYDLKLLAPAGLRRFTRAEYDRLIEDGFFANDEANELIHGFMVRKMTIGERHRVVVDALLRALVLALHDVAWVSAGGPLAASDDSEPEPDITVLRGRDLPARPDGRRAALVVEVSESSLRYDREVKGPIYAAAGVAEYWIVNLVDDVVEIHREPSDGAYRERATAAAGDTIAPLEYPSAAFAVGDILRPA